MEASSGNSRSPAGTDEAEDPAEGPANWDDAAKLPRARRAIPVFETDYAKVLAWDAFARTALYTAMGLWLLPGAAMSVWLVKLALNHGQWEIPATGLAMAAVGCKLTHIRGGLQRTFVFVLAAAQVFAGRTAWRTEASGGWAGGLGAALGLGGALCIIANAALVVILMRVDRMKLPGSLQGRMGAFFQRNYVVDRVEEMRKEQETDGSDWNDREAAHGTH